MGVYIDGAINALTKAFNPKYWLHFLLISIIAFLVSGAFGIIFLLLSVLAVSGILGVDLIGLFLNLMNGNTASATSVGMQLLQVFLNPAILTSLIIAVAVLFIVFLIFMTLIDSFFQAAFYFLARNFLKTGSLDIGNVFSGARERFFTLFKVNLLIGILLLVLALIVFLPVILSIPALLAQLPGFALAAVAPSSAAPALAFFLSVFILFIVLFFAFVAILFFLIPYFAMFMPVALFEGLGAIDSIKRGIELVKGNYLGSLGFLVLFAILVFVSVLVSMLVGFSISVLTMLFFGFVVLSFIWNIVFNVWLSSYSVLSYVTLYEINSSKGVSKKKTGSSFVGVITK